MQTFNKQIEKIYEELFGESLSDELEKVKLKIQGMPDEDDSVSIKGDLGDIILDEDDSEETDDAEETDDIEGSSSDDIDDEDIESDEPEDDGNIGGVTSDDGVDVAQIYSEVDLAFDDLSDNELELEVHTNRQQLFDLEDQFGPNSNEYMECFIKTRIAYQKLNSDTVSPDSDLFYQLWGS